MTISFEIEGGSDPAQDRDGLRRFLYERKLKARKLAALVQAGSAVTSLDDLKIDAAERPTRLFLITPRLSGPGGHVEFKLKKD
jgi:hypothetical protein